MTNMNSLGLRTKRNLSSRHLGLARRFWVSVLGLRILAEVLGGRVYQGREKEIGWFPVRKRPEAISSSFMRDLPDSFLAFHWHGETFDLPAGATHLAETDVCPNQAFGYGGKALALQFHLEVTPEGVQDLARHCANELETGGSRIQTGTELLGKEDQFKAIEYLLFSILDRLDRDSS